MFRACFASRPNIYSSFAGNLTGRLLYFTVFMGPCFNEEFIFVLAVLLLDAFQPGCEVQFITSNISGTLIEKKPFFSTWNLIDLKY